MKRRLKRGAVVLGAAFVTLGLSGCDEAFGGPSQILNFLSRSRSPLARHRALAPSLAACRSRAKARKP